MAEEQERTLTISVESNEKTWKRAEEAARRIDAGEGYQGEYYAFASMSLLFRVFSVKRWELIVKLQQTGPSSLRKIARELGRDVKRVHEDAAVLLEEGVIERDAKGKLFVPFASIRFEADLPTMEAASASESTAESKAAA